MPPSAPSDILHGPVTQELTGSADKLVVKLCLFDDINKNIHTHTPGHVEDSGAFETVSRWILFGTTLVSQRERRRRISCCLSSIELLLNVGRKRMC